MLSPTELLCQSSTFSSSFFFMSHLLFKSMPWLPTVNKIQSKLFSLAFTVLCTLVLPHISHSSLPTPKMTGITWIHALISVIISPILFQQMFIELIEHLLRVRLSVRYLHKFKDVLGSAPARVTIQPKIPSIILDLALKVTCPGEHLSPGELRQLMTPAPDHK